MSGEMQVDSVKRSTPLPQEATKDVTNENKQPLIEINFKSETAKKVTQAGLPVIGLGVELGHRAGEEIVDSAEEIKEAPSVGQRIKDNVHRNAEWAKEKPYRLLVGWGVILLDAYINANK